MVEVALVSTPEGFTNNSLMTPNPYMSTKNPSARKPLHQFSEILDVKHKTDVQMFVGSNENRKAKKR